MERNPQIWTKLNGIPNPNPSPLCRITRSQFFSDHPFLLRRWLSFLTETPYTARERASERASESDTQRERARSREREREKERKSQRERWRVRDQVREGAALDRSFGFGGETGRGGPGRYLDPKNSTLRISPPLALGLPSSSSEGRMPACQSLSLSLSLYSSLHFVNAV